MVKLASFDQSLFNLGTNHLAFQISKVFFTVLTASALLKKVSLFLVFTLLTDEGDIKTFHSFVNNVPPLYF